MQVRFLSGAYLRKSSAHDLDGAFLFRCPINPEYMRTGRTLRPMDREAQVLRDTDPRCAELEASGYILLAESWGARLRIGSHDDMTLYEDSIKRVVANQVHIEELSAEFANAVFELEMVNNPDYPRTPATSRSLPSFESIRSLWCEGNRIFGGISSGVLVGALATSRRESLVELDFASILREHRGKGIGKALRRLQFLDG